MAKGIGRTPLPDSNRIARARPPGRDEVSLSKVAIEYDLQDLASKRTVETLISRVMNPSVPPPFMVIYSLAMPGEYSVAGSPGTNGGAFIVNWQDVTANYGLRGPASGAVHVPTFRKDINDDLPYRSKIKIVSSTFGATVTPDASLASQFSVVATSNFILAAPVNAIDGQKLTLRITQDATGSRLMTYDAAYRFSTYLDAAFCTLTTTPGATDYLGVEANFDTGTFDVIAFVPGCM